jgi:hypothetical protein
MDALNYRKKLKYTDPDLTVVLGYGPTMKTVKAHSLILACHSGYFESLLASNMMEAAEKRVELTDVDPAQFLLALEYVDNCTKSLSTEDAMFIGPFYDRFDFRRGMVLVEQALLRDMNGVDCNMTRSFYRSLTSQDITKYTNLTLFAKATNLHEVLAKGKDILSKIYKPGGVGLWQCKPDVLTETHVKEAMPLFVDYPGELLPEGLETQDMQFRLFAELVVLYHRNIIRNAAQERNTRIRADT